MALLSHGWANSVSFLKGSAPSFPKMSIALHAATKLVWMFVMVNELSHDTHRNGTGKIGNVEKYGHYCLPDQFTKWCDFVETYFTLSHFNKINVEWTAKMLHWSQKPRLLAGAASCNLDVFSFIQHCLTKVELPRKKDIGTLTTWKRLRLGNLILFFGIFGNGSTTKRWVPLLTSESQFGDSMPKIIRFFFFQLGWINCTRKQQRERPWIVW